MVTDALSKDYLEKIEVYNKNKVVWFFSKEDEYFELSNMFSGMPIKFNGETWNSSEALYQACKYPPNIMVCPKTNPNCKPKDVRERILKSKTPMQAKMTQKCAKDYIRKDWEDVKVDAMLWVLKLKAQQHKKFRDVLISTKDKVIVERSKKDCYWGCKEISVCGEEFFIGFNVLGKLLMYVRDNLDGILEEDLTKEGYLL